MRFYINLTFTLLAITILFSCQKSEKNTEEIIHKKYGTISNIGNLNSIDLDINKFKTWEEFHNQINQMVCYDLFPKISLKSDKESKTIYLENPCRKKYICLLIYSDQIITIKNDCILNDDDETYLPIDSLESYMKKLIRKIDDKYADTSETVILSISYDKLDIYIFTELLKKLTTTYDKVSNKSRLSIWISLPDHSRKNLN